MKPRDGSMGWLGRSVILLIGLAILHRSSADRPAGGTRDACHPDADRRSGAKDWKKAFDDGTARLSRSLFLLIGLAFALVCLDLVRGPDFLERMEEDWGRIASSRVWVLEVWVLSGAAVLALLFVAQFLISFSPYAEALQSLLDSRGWGEDPRRAKLLMGAAFAAISLPIFVGSVLIADGTVRNALAFTRADGGTDVR